MSFVVCLEKLQCRKLVCGKMNFHFIMINIFIMFHMIIPVCSLFYLPFFVFTWYIIPCLRYSFDKLFLNFSAKLLFVFFVAVCTVICASKHLQPGSWTVVIRWRMKCLSVAFSPYKKYLQCAGELIPQSIVVLKYCDNIDNKYNTVAHL